MRRRTQQRWLDLSRWLSLLGLAGIVGWNIGHARWPALPAPPWWLALMAPLPGLLSWLAAQMLPLALARANKRAKSFRLTYDVPPDWDDTRFRRALRNLIAVSPGIDLVWARDNYGLGCWLLADDDLVLQRLVSDLLPGGTLEEESFPAPGRGAAVLHWHELPPPPAELCQMDGIDGLYFRWLGPDKAVTALWGDQAAAVCRRYARQEDSLVMGQGETLLRPPFVGDNPWPELPPFVSSTIDAGLSSVSLLVRTAPPLRLNGRDGLHLGRDAEQHLIGFDLPDLKTLRLLHVYGQTAAAQSLDLAYQAIRAGLSVAFLDGSGVVTGQLTRRLARPVAAGQVLTCDVERPAQSRQRLNPLWLPTDQSDLWPGLLTGVWTTWLRELGVTPAGLGRTAFWHARVAVMLTGLLAARRGLALDPVALLETLETPEFLARVGDVGGPEVFGPELWHWWQTEGRQTHNFDVHLRLGHLRERLSGLLDLPEYGILWRPPFTDPADIAARRLSLIWRLPDPRRRLHGYITSQLLALASLLAAWPGLSNAAAPFLMVLYELEGVDNWVDHLCQFPAARVMVVSRRLNRRPPDSQLLLSRLDRTDAEWLRAEGWPANIRATDLRRLPDHRLILRRGKHISTLDVLT